MSDSAISRQLKAVRLVAPGKLLKTPFFGRLGLPGAQLPVE